MTNEELQEAIDAAIKYLTERDSNSSFIAVYDQLVLLLKIQVHRAECGSCCGKNGGDDGSV